MILEAIFEETLNIWSDAEPCYPSLPRDPYYVVITSHHVFIKTFNIKKVLPPFRGGADEPNEKCRHGGSVCSLAGSVRECVCKY